MITCDQAIEIIRQNEIGDTSEIGISPFTNADVKERGGYTGTWMKPKNIDQIDKADSDKIVIAIKIKNSKKMNHYDICRSIITSGLLKDFFYVTFQNNPEVEKRYFVKLQYYNGQTTLAKIYPIIEKSYIKPFDMFDQELLLDVPNEVELNNKLCYFGSPIIFERD